MAPMVSSLAVATQLYDAGDFARLTGVCQELLNQQPCNVEAKRLLAAAARKQERYDESERWLAEAIQVAPQEALLWFDRGSTAFQAGQLQRAADYYRRAAKLSPSLGEAHLNVGGVLEQLERQSEALPYASRAAELLPHNPIAHYNLANIFRALADLPRAISSFNRALALDPNYARVHWNLATCYLLQGDFRRGWEKYEWRERVEAVFLDRYTQPRWDGSSLAGKSLLIHAEQGIGDEILFASCYHELIEQAKQLILVCEPRLATLFRRSFPRATVYGYARKKDWQPLAVPEMVDFQIAAGSLPLYLRPDRQSFPARERFLTADAGQVDAWRRKFESLGPGIRVGISWRAGGRTSERRRRTTELEHWNELFALPNVHWVNLQYGDSDEEIALAREQFGVTIHDWPDGDPLVDLDGFAAKIAALDLVISVGNATTHMAGALGTPGWVLLPLVPGWRWMIDGERSVWYDSLRLFRQPAIGDWHTPFAEVRESLAAFLAQRGYRSAALQIAPQLNSVRLQACTETENERLDAVQDDRQLSDVVIPRLVDEAIAHHQAGRRTEAETLYRQVLRRAPRQVDALHMLGVLARQTGRAELAIQLISRALAVTDTQPVIHYSFANALADAGRLDEAVASFKRAIMIKPDFHEAHLNLGQALERLGRHTEALSTYQTLAILDPNSAVAQYNLGCARRQSLSLDEAAECFQRAITLDPKFVKAHNALAGVLLEDGQSDAAETIIRQAIAAAPTYAAAHHTLANILRDAHRADEAIEHFRTALELEPNRVDSLHNLAHLLLCQGETTEAEAAYRWLLRIAPHDSHAASGLGVSLEEQGRYVDAIAAYESAMQMDPHNAAAHSNAALARFHVHDFARGWDDYEWRWHCKDGPRPRDFFSQPLWQVEKLAEKTILIHGEQGLGDEIMFATCVPEMIERARHCVLACDRRLAATFARSFPRATVLPMRRSREHLLDVPAALEIDYQIPAGSVPRYLRRGASDFPRRQQLLAADAARVTYWRQRLSSLGGNLSVGISWRAGNTAKDRRTRWTGLEAWRGLLQVPGVSFVSLQYGEARADLTQLQAGSGAPIHTFAECDPKHDIDELAAQISALDLVISVGNANVHLAGALGVPAWALVPHHPRWSWTSFSGDESMWYASVRLFRQPSKGDWSACFAAIVAELQLRLAQTADNH